MASEDLNVRNGVAVGGSKEDNTSKGILPQFVQSLEQSSDEAATHEGLGELFREAVLSIPTIFIKVFPKIWQHHREGVLIEYLTLKFIRHKGALRQVSKRVLGLGLSGQCLFTFIHLFLRSWGSCLFFSLSAQPGASVSLLFSFLGASFFGWISVNFLASNCTIFSHSFTSPKMTLNWGWLMQVRGRSGKEKTLRPVYRATAGCRQL